MRELADLVLNLHSEKPSAAIAIFPLEKYTGTYTRDLFEEDESTYFDDAEQFFALQNEAVEALAEEHRAKVAWVDVLNVYAVSWWRYREAKRKEPAGVVINPKPNGRVEIRKGLARYEVTQEVTEAINESLAPRERPAVSKGLVRYAALQKSMAVQAALLSNPRKGKEVAAVHLLLAFGTDNSVRIAMHPCVAGCGSLEIKPQALTAVLAEASELLRGVMRLADDFGSPTWTGAAEETPLELYKAVQRLSDKDLDRLSVWLILLSFG